VAAPLPLVQCCTPITESISDADARDLERVFKALADRHRVKILAALSRAGGEPVCVCDFAALLDVPQPNASYHLKQLLDAGLLERSKRGSYAYYALADGALERVGALLTDRGA
jgi:ArsR family transcriptional regulator